jgi:hypothetical protein
LQKVGSKKRYKVDTTVEFFHQTRPNSLWKKFVMPDGQVYTGRSAAMEYSERRMEKKNEVLGPFQWFEPKDSILRVAWARIRGDLLTFEIMNEQALLGNGAVPVVNPHLFDEDEPATVKRTL